MFERSVMSGFLGAALLRLMKQRRIVLLAVVVTAFATSPVLAELVQVDFSSHANFSWLDHDVAPHPTGVRLPGAPTGETTLGGVPFNIKSNADGNQAFLTFGNGGEQDLTISTDIYGATDVYTLINSMCGQPGPTSYAWLNFVGSEGATYTKYLVGNQDIRDYNNGNWTNSISPPAANVFTCIDNFGTVGRLDMQHIALPASFANQTLTSIELVDVGADNFQRSVLDGVTVSAVPEPATLALLGIGAAVFLGFAWRRRWAKAT
jgi:hypothetical protein